MKRITDELRESRNESKRWEPIWNEEQRSEGHEGWEKAVTRTLD